MQEDYECAIFLSKMRTSYTALVLLVLHIYNGATCAAAPCQQTQNFTVGSYIYTVCGGSMSWNDSAASCMEWTNGGVLATFENLPQLGNVTERINGNRSVWLGGRQYGGWTWLDGSAVNASINNNGSNEYCMAIYRNKITAVPCHDSIGRHFLCHMNSISDCEDNKGARVLNSKGRCIELFHVDDTPGRNFTWANALDKCSTFGAKLASLGSDINTVIANISEMHINHYIYVGGQFSTWRWTNNESFSTSRMSPNMTKQPTGTGRDTPSQPLCLLLDNIRDHLLGTSCDDQHSYLCQAPVVAATTDSNSISTVAAPVASADDTHTLAIILGAVGGFMIVLIIVIVVLVICIRRKRSKKNDTRSGDFEYHDTIFNNSRGSSTSRSAGSDHAPGPDDTADPGYSTITDVTPSPTPGSMTVAADSHNHTEVGHLDRPVADGGQSVSTNNTHGGRTSFPYSEIRDSQMGQKNGFSKAAAAGPSTSAGQNYGYSEIGAAVPNPDDDGYSRAKAIPPDSFGYSEATKIAAGTVNDAYEDDEQPGPSSPKVSVLASNNKAGKGKRGRAYPYASTRIESIIAREDQYVRDHDQKEGGALNSLKKRLSLLLKRNHPQSRDVLPAVQQSPSTGSGPDVVPASHYEEMVGVSGQGSTLTTHSGTSGTMSSQLPNPGEDLDILDNVSYGYVHN